ncbi:MAG: response regulator, partial [Cyanobacteria bacterium J06553_1]
MAGGKTAPAAPTSPLQPLHQAADLRVEQTPYAAPPKNMRLRMASAIPAAVPKPIINPVGYPVSHPVVDEAKVPAPPQASDANSNNAFTLLVVNDNITNRKVLSAHLQRKGYTVVSADSPRSALTILHEFSIDLVLLDIMTPDDGNLNTLQKIRETYPKTILAVVLITVNDSDEEVVR